MIIGSVIVKYSVNLTNIIPVVVSRDIKRGQHKELTI